MGASTAGLVALMSVDFSKLVIMAFAISAPVAWWLITLLLERYPDHIRMPWWVFPLTGAVALVFALGIVVTQALRAAQANPVKSLRNE